MDVQKLWDFAIVVTGNVAGVAADTIHLVPYASQMKMDSRTASVEKIRVMNLGFLSARLIEVKHTLEYFELHQEETIRRRLPGLLAQLEQACTWPHGSPRDRQKADPVTTFIDYPTLEAVLDPSTTTREPLASALASFASTGGNLVRKFCENLDKFAGPAGRKTRRLDALTVCIDAEQEDCIILPKDYPPLVNDCLSNILFLYSKCTCVSTINVDARTHSARLRLKGKVQHKSDDILFDLQFSAAPVSLWRASSTGWQQIEVQIPRAKPHPKSRTIRWEDEKSSPSRPTQEEKPTRLVQVGDFCTLLREDIGDACLRLKVIDGCLHKVSQVGQADQRTVSAPSISLSRLLELEEISTKGKILLAYILARSVWQYYDSDFMKTNWTTESIQFMREHQYEGNIDKDREKIDPSTPFLAFTSTEWSLHASIEQYQTGDVLHHFPRILALGIMLADVGRKNPTRVAHLAISAEAQINKNLAKYQDILKSPTWPSLDVRNPDIKTRFRNAVRTCLDPKVFHVTSPKSRAQSCVEKRRDIIYRRVVFPLEQLCTELGIIDQPRDDQLINYVGALSISDSIPNGLLLSEIEERSFPKSSKEWMECAMDTRHLDLALQFRLKNLVPRVRIAILDTGYDSDAPFFRLPVRRKRLVEWKDFAEDSPVGEDRDGHGTYVVSLAMKLAPAADICVARVALNSSSLPEAGQKIAEAIEWAAKTANADIISMSFGFSEEPRVKGQNVISNAIAQTLAERDQRILFFAAAANDGGNQTEMFPARHQSVLSIRATNHYGTFLDLNPPPNPKGPAVIGTLGHNVAGAALSGGDGDHAEYHRTGTSIATPIAAGIAATVLGYARLGLDKGELDRKQVNCIEMERGMRAMLLQLSRQMDGKKHYLRPDGFIGATDRERNSMLFVNANQER